MTIDDKNQDLVAANRQAWSMASQWGADHRMNELETLMWRSERHPRGSSTICTLMLLDRVPEWDRLRAAHDWATKMIHRLRERVLEPLVPVGPPAWTVDPSFDLDYHLRRTQLPAPAGMKELLAFAQSAAMAPFDRTRPLWEGTLIEGLPDSKAAYLLKLHHSLTDGVGSVQMLSLIQSRTAEHTPKDPIPEPVPSPDDPDAQSLAVDELNETIRRIPAAARGLLSAGTRALLRPGAAADEALRLAASARRTIAPPPVAGSPLLRMRTGKSWRFGVFECELKDLKAAAKAASGSLNDAYVAVLLGGLRHYHEMFGYELDEIPMAMPLSLRKADDPMGGNKFAGAMFAAPIGVVDPAERIAIIRGTVLSLRVEPALGSMEFAAPVVNRLPSALGAAAMRLGSAADISASNVPGIPYPVYMAGARIERAYPFGPLPGVAIMAAMVSHAGTCCFGLNCDGTAVPDVALLVQCMKEGLDEVLALGRS